MDTTIVGEIGYTGFDCYGLYKGYMTGCHNSGPKTLYIRCLIGIQKRTIILSTTHIEDM